MTLLCASAVLNAEESSYVVVIDPGHGGKDSGCVGKLTNEKTIVLDVAKRLGKLINDEYPDIKVVYTRTDNTFLSLQQRAAVANGANGNVFISIHVNSVDRRNRNRTTIQGASVYTLGLHKSDSNLSVAMRENSVMELEDDYSETYQGFDPNSSESYIIFELNQNVHMQRSLELADAMQHELVTTAGRADKGVRQAGFWVLWATSMPSVLVELDFICNPASEKFLNSSEGKDKCATALFNAFSKYYTHSRTDNNAPKVANNANADRPTANDNAGGKRQKAEKAVDNKGQVTYHVQLLASRKVIPAGDSEIRGIDGLNYFKDGKFYKYYCGRFTSFKEAKKCLKKMQKRFPKAFIIKMRDGKCI